MDSFSDKARKHWTQERIKKLTGGKKLLLTPDQAPELLRVMSLLNSDGSMSANKIRKYRQINHTLALLSDSLQELSKKAPIVRILDVGCGNSYMTLLLAWYFKEKLNHPMECIGLDPNPKVIAASQERAKILNYDSVKFFVGDIKDVSWDQIYSQSFASEEKTRPHLVLGLHACDTASDYAFAFAIQNKSDCIAVAPCCQAELARKWKTSVDSDNPFVPVFRSHHFRRELAAEMTDVFRMLLVRSRGYEVTATEFVTHEHAMKNRLLIATRRGAQLHEATQQYERLKESLGGHSVVLEDILRSP
jgi:SAM-dependent methyltransferase